MEKNIGQLLQLVQGKYSIDVALKPEQLQVITQVIRGNDCIAVLPTGFGKSLCYMLPPLLLDEADPENSPHHAIVVSPLNSLMIDQVERCNVMGIKAVACKSFKAMEVDVISSELRSPASYSKSAPMSTHLNHFQNIFLYGPEFDTAGMQNGNFNIIYGSPEQLLSKSWMSLLKTLHNVCLIAFDEVHCVSEWGLDFRPGFRDAVALCSVFSPAPTLGLSATVNKQVLHDIKTALELTDAELVAVLPDRPNIFLDIQNKASFSIEDDLAWVAEGLQRHKQEFPKTIIYAQTILQVVDIYEFLADYLGTDGFAGGDCRPENRLFSMYHGQIGAELQNFLVKTFCSQFSPVRVLVSTIAFGLGIEVPDVRTIIHWGKAKSLMTFWQECGRGGRDGKGAKAIWYPKSTVGDDKDVFDRLKNDKTCCVRLVILEHFMLNGSQGISLLAMETPRPHCCSHCDSQL